MPATREAVHATDAYRYQLLAIRAQLTRLLIAQWRAVDVVDLNGTYKRWLDAATITLAAAQRHGVQLTTSYLTVFLSAELGKPTTPAVHIVPDLLAGKGMDGRPLDEVLLPALFTVKIAIGQRRTFSEALTMGLNRALRTAAVEYEAASRSALDQLLAGDQRVAGWRRVTSGNACGACLAAATGAIQREQTTMPVHAHCRCTKEPVVRGVRERYQRPTGRETFDAMTSGQQDALLGVEKADLIRSGQVPFDRLIAEVPMVHAPDGITEAPLQALHH